MIGTSKSRKKQIAEIAALDIETGSDGKLLDIGYYDGETIRYFSNWKDYIAYLRTIRKDTLVYSHNGGGFDYVNFLIDLFRNGISFSAMMKNSKIFCFWIDEMPNIKFVDSFCILPVSLEKIAKSFTDLEKLKIDESVYKKMEVFKKQNKSKYYQYLELDCVTLYNAIIKFRQIINEIHEIGNIPLSIGGTSMRLFIKEFLDHKIVVPSKSEKDFVFSGYIGGRCEYLGFGNKNREGWYERTNGYDFNSHYPAQMIKHKFPIYKGSWTNKGVYENDELQTGVYRATFKQTTGRIPILKPQNLDYDFSGSGIYTHLELNQILRMGGKVEIIEGYHYEFCEDIFAKFVDFFFSKRIQAQKIGDDARNILYKLVLNNLYGKFGQRDEVESLQVLSEEQAFNLIHHKEINELVRIDESTAFYSVREEKKCRTSFPTIAAMITASARIQLCEVLESCEYPIYCDTDSIHCQDELSDDLLGDDLGKLKVEFYNSYARYGGKKSYEIQGEKIRQKGIPNKAINPDLFSEMFEKGKAEIIYQKPLLLKSAIKKIDDLEPSKWHTFKRTIARDKSFFEKGIDNHQEM